MSGMIDVLERPRLPALTSVRFFAALWVALFHMQAMQAFTFSAPVIARFASVGYAGVSFFFVLSGFILVYTYSGRVSTLREFWQARFARIYPALLFSLLVTAPGFFFVCSHMRANDPHLLVPEWTWSTHHLPLAVLLNLTLLQSWLPSAALSWNMPAWSLSVEAFFYLLFPLLLPRLARLSRPQLLAFAPAGCALTLACALTYTHLQPDGPVDLRTLGPWTNFIKFNPLIHLPEFLMGMAAGLLFLHHRPEPHLPAQSRAWPLTLAGLAATLALIALSPHIPYVALHTALLAPAFTVLIYGLALRPRGIGFLETRPMEALGEASYPFYLLHTTLILYFFLDMRTQTAKHQTALGFVTWLLLITSIALLVDRLIERPLRRRLRPRVKAPALVPVTAQA